MRSGVNGRGAAWLLLAAGLLTAQPGQAQLAEKPSAYTAQRPGFAA